MVIIDFLYICKNKEKVRYTANYATGTMYYNSGEMLERIYMIKSQITNL